MSSFFTRLFLSLVFISLSGGFASAHSSMHGFSEQVQDKLRTGDDFSLRVQADGSLFHRSGEVNVSFKTFQSEGKKCGNLEIKGHGHIFREFKSDLSHWARKLRNDALKISLKGAVICIN